MEHAMEWLNESLRAVAEAGTQVRQASPARVQGASPLTQVCAQSAVRKYMRYGHQHVVTTVLYLC